MAALKYRGHHEEALFVDMVFDTYCRFSEAHELKGSDVLKPVERLEGTLGHWAIRLRPEQGEKPTKAGGFDDVIVLDTEDKQYLGPLLGARKKLVGDAGAVFSFSPNQMRQRWAWACQALGVQDLELCIHALRHGGASRDVREKLRPMLEVQRRGRWASSGMLMRYAKLGRLQAVLGKITDVTIEYCEYAQQRRSAILRGHCSQVRRPPFA